MPAYGPQALAVDDSLVLKGGLVPTAIDVDAVAMS